ncbi:restriction endonuclease [Iodobacter sp. CM08]|uniref:VENN motif pre-toxin domain-containing protein n=1 Tax=Iodobacter sp. CM08 TaxID=3085902 RepID=UPI002981486C|nr:VENN motif pre-toxin domain-containing protein [Iodobacter sp. CM08]MDW5415700.1 restriction endonuclease [Iodobacter sp. CM08]
MSASYDKTHNDYAAVNEQSGIFAGKDGFDIKVKNNTDLTGAVIASSSDASKNKLSTGTLTQKDIRNHAETSAIGLGGGLDFSSSNKGKEQTAQTKEADKSNVNPSSPVVVGAKESDSSSTKSAISKGQITLTDDAKQKALTGQTAAETIASLNHDTDGAQQKLANNFDKQQLAEQMAAAKALVQETGRFMANRAANADKAKAALEATDKALTVESAKPAGQKDQARIDDLIQLQARQTEQKADADKWTPGGEYGRAMTVLQAAVGGNVTGGMSGLLQNATVGYLQSIGAEKIKEIADSFQTKKGTEDASSGTLRAALHAIASCAGAAATSSNCSSAAVGAASSVVINSALTAADSLTDTQKEQRKNLVGSLIAGIAEATGGNAAAANNAAQIEMENNYLSTWQKEAGVKETAECKGGSFCEAVVAAKHFGISMTQDLRLVSGMGLGVVLEANALGNAIVELPKVVSAVMADPSLLKQLPAGYAAQIQEKYDAFLTARETAGPDGATTAGVYLVQLANLVAPIVSGGIGAGKAVASISKDSLETLATLSWPATGSLRAQYGVMGDAALINATWQVAKTEKSLAPLGSALAKAGNGDLGEMAIANLMRQQGYTDVIAIKNNSGHGIDIIARNAEGKLVGIEAKTSTTGKTGTLSPDQRLGSDAFVRSRIERAANATDG